MDIRVKSLAFAALAAMLPLCASALDSRLDIVVKVTKDGPNITVDVDCPVDAPWPVVWDVLTDFDHMAEFISNVAVSLVVEQGVQDVLRVHQKGSASVGPFSLPFDNVREIEMVPHREIRSRMVSGDFKASAFVTRIALVGGRIHIVNSGRYTPNMWVPPFIGPALIETETRKQFAEIRAEILRRSAKVRLPGVPDTEGMCASRRTGEMIACNLGGSERRAPAPLQPTPTTATDTK
jgi:hypothetical protein